MQFVPPQTIRFIHEAVDALRASEGLGREAYERLEYHWWRRYDFESAEKCRNFILRLESLASQAVVEGAKLEVSDTVSERYPVVHETVDVIPIYKDAIAL